LSRLWEKLMDRILIDVGFHPKNSWTMLILWCY
jgi:hypothetical protein